MQAKKINTQKSKTVAMTKVPKTISLKTGSRSITSTAPAAIGESRAAYFKLTSFKHRRFGDAVRIRGQDLLTIVQTPASGDGAGRTLSEVYINPQELGSSRLSRFGALYERYLMKDFKLHWVPAVGTASSGNIGMACDRDIADATPPQGEQGLRQFLSFEGAKTFPVWKPTTVDVKLECPDTPYYTSPNGVEDRLAYQGQVYVFTVVPGLVGTVIGVIWVEYDVELYIPQLESLAISSTASTTSVQPTVADGLLPFAPQSNPTLGVNNSPGVTFVNPGVICPTTALKLAEGVYDLYINYAQNAAGAATTGTPVLTPLQPQTIGAPVAPQPAIRVQVNQQSTATGNLCVKKMLLDVPKGGAYLTMPMTTVSGLAAAAGAAYFLMRLSDFKNLGDFNSILA